MYMQVIFLFWKQKLKDGIFGENYYEISATWLSSSLKEIQRQYYWTANGCYEDIQCNLMQQLLQEFLTPLKVTVRPAFSVYWCTKKLVVVGDPKAR